MEGLGWDRMGWHGRRWDRRGRMEWDGMDGVMDARAHQQAPNRDTGTNKDGITTARNECTGHAR